MILENDLFKKSNISIIPSKFIEQEHKTFIKYLKDDNYKYTYDILKILSNNSKSINKISLFHKSMKCLLKVIYNLYNIENPFDYDLLILSCFYIGLKLNELRTKVPKIKKLKEIYPQKYNNYDQISIRQTELICIKLLNYNIDIVTSYDCLFGLLYNNNILFDSACKELENITKNNIIDFLSIPPLDIAHYCINKAKRLKHYYIHPSLLMTEYNKKNNEKRPNKLDDSCSIQTTSTFTKLKHSYILSSETIYSDQNNDKNIKRVNNQKNSIYNCSFKILKKLSNVNKTNKNNNNTNETNFTDFKNSFNFNINKSIIGKKLYENNINTTSKKSILLFKSINFSNKNKEEKENYSNSNLLLNRNKDINCTRYYNKVIMIGQKKLFQD